MNHADEHRPDDPLEQLFERWLEDPDALDASERARLEAEPRLRERLQAVRDVERELHVEAEEWRSKALDREPLPAPELQESLRARFEEIAAPAADARQAPRSGEAWRTVLWTSLAAAAAGLLVWFWPHANSPEPIRPAPPEVLSGDRLQVTVDADSARLSWSRATQVDETVVIRVVDPVRGEAVYTERLQGGEDSFTPSDAQLRAWPDPFQVEIEVHDIDGETVGGPTRVQVRRPRRVGMSAREPPENADLARLRLEADAARATGDLETELCAGAERVTVLAQLERFDLAERLCAELTDAADAGAAPIGSVVLELARIELALQAADLERASVALRVADSILEAVEIDYGTSERIALEVLVRCAGSRCELSTGRADLALRSAQRAVELADSLGDHPAAADRQAAARLDLARASLAARRPDQTLRIADEVAADLGAWSPDTLELLLLRSHARGLYLGVTDRDLESALADLDVLLAAPQASRRLRFAAFVARAALLWNAARSSAAAECCERAESELGEIALEGGDRSAPPASLLMLRAIETRIGLGSEDPEMASRRATGLSRLLDRLVFSGGSADADSVTAPLLDVGRRAALSAWFDALRAAQPGARGIEEAFLALCQAQALGSMARYWEVGVPTLAEVRALIRPSDVREPDAALWSYSFGWRRSHLFVVGPEGVACFDIPFGEEALRTLAREFRSDPADPLVGRRLAEALAPPAVVEHVAGTRRVALTLVGLHDLGGVPMEALPLGDRGHLGDHADLGYLPSVPVGVALARRERLRRGSSSTAQVVLVGGPDREQYGFELGPDAIADFVLTDRANALLGLGAEATVATLFEPGVAEATALVLVAHGERDPVSGAATVLLAEADGDGVLDPMDFDSLARGSDAAPALPPLAVVFVCGAARQRILRGEDGAQGLAGGLLRGGARAVVLAQDDVEFAAARRFARVFGDEIVTGASPARALREGLLALDADPVRAADRLGALHVVGLAHRPVWAAPRPGQNRGVLAAACAVAVALLGWALRSSRTRRPAARST